MALPIGIDSSRELLDAQAHVWNHIYNFVNSISLKCAIQLGIPDAIQNHRKPITLSHLVDSLPINKAKSNGLRRLMRLLVHSRFFDQVRVSGKDGKDEEAYCLTPASRLLLKDEPFSIAPYALAVFSPVMFDPFLCITEWLQNDDPTQFHTALGKGVWEYTGIDQTWYELYYDAIGRDSKLVASLLVKECKHMFQGLKTMVDVGGGPGVVSKALVDAFLGLKCTVLDLPHVVAGLEGSENLNYVGGDMFVSVPHADAVFLKWNLIMWTHEESVKLLKNCKEAISDSKNGGKVIIVEMVVNDEREEREKGTETQLFFDMHVMTGFAGGERTEKEWANLFFDAGFKSYKITPALGLRSVIEVFP